MRKVARAILVLTVAGSLGAGGPGAAAGPADCLAPAVDERCEAWAARERATDSTTISYWVNHPTVSAGSDLVFTSGIRGEEQVLATVAHDAETGEERWDAEAPEMTSWGSITQALAPDGSTLFVAGHGAGRLAVVAYRSDTGAVAWQVPGVAVEQGTDTPSYPRGIAVSPDGATLYVGGVTSRRGDRDLFLVALDAGTGAERWRHVYRGPAGRDEAGGVVAVDPTGERVYLTGTQDIVPSYPDDQEEGDVVVLAFGAAEEGGGDLLWTASFDGPAGYRDAAHAIVAAGGGVYVGATLDRNLGTASHAADLAVLAFDGMSGSLRWAATHDGPAGGPDSLTGLAAAPGGGTVYAAGWTSAVFTRAAGDTAARSATDYDAVVLALDAASGAIAWTTPLGLPGHTTEGTTGIAVAPDGEHVYATGLSEVAGYGFLAINGGSFTADSGLGSYATAALSADGGTPVWSARYRAEADEGARPWSISMAPDGSRVYVAGMVSRAVVEADTLEMPSAYVTVAYEA